MTIRLISWFTGGASIRTKLIISFSLLVSIPVLVLGTFSFTQARRNIEAQTIQTAQSNTARLVSELDTRLQREIDFTKYLAYNLNFRNALGLAGKDPVKLARELNNDVENNLWYFVTSDSYMKAIEVFSPDIDAPLGPFLRPDAEHAGQAWYETHRTAFGTLWHVAEGRLYASRTVLDTATSSRMIGVMRVEFFPRLVTEPIDSMQYMDNGIRVLDNAGKTVYEKRSGDEVTESLMDAYIAGQTAPDAQGRQIILIEAQMDTTGWRIYYYVNRQAISIQLFPIIRSTLLVVGLCIVVVILLIGLLSRMFSRRLLGLKSAAEDVAEGNFGIAQATNDTDEIGVVINSFASMAHQLDEMIDRVYRMEIDKKSTELKALQAMINPHFLYNTLSSIKWKALYSGNDEIGEIVSQIARFYRTSLNNGQQITTVENELANIRAYITLQQIMHDHSFDAEFEVDDAQLQTPILNFILQPIVENAIQHGLEHFDSSAQRGKIWICVSTEGASLLFDIINNGNPIDADNIQKILSTPGNGYGIYNIRQRIELYYAQGSGIDARVLEDGRTCFTVRLIPAQAEA